MFPIAVLQGRAWISGADWKIAGQLTDVSATMRAQMQAAVDAHRRETAAKANAQATAQVIAETRLAGDRQERVLHAIGFHPALCRESAQWAYQRHRDALDHARDLAS